jgi:hypothetical protein
MASHEIAPLKCPSCGSSTTGPSKPLAFGAEFSCAHCGGTSVLIINRALHPVDALQKSGDQVCAVCGRVAKLDARFCQDGHTLVRRCVSQECLKEFPAHHQRCDYCGWLQEVMPGTLEAEDLELESAIRDLSDSSAQVIAAALEKVRKAGGSGKRAAASIVNLLQDAMRCKLVAPLDGQPCLIEQHAWHTLAMMGEDAAEAVPLLLQRITDAPESCWTSWGQQNHGLCLVLASIAPQEAMPICRKEIASAGKDRQGPQGPYVAALTVAQVIGRPAIPILLEHCGLFSGKRGKDCQYIANQISQFGSKVPHWEHHFAYIDH